MTEPKDPTSKKKKSDYVPAPEISTEIRERYTTILEVMSGLLSVTEGAERLGLSRNRFQTLMHRAQAGLLEELAPKASGRPKEKGDEEKALLDEVEKLKKENEKLLGRVETFERLLGVAGDLLRGRTKQVKRTGRNSRSTTSKTSTSTSTSSDEEEEQRTLLDKICELRALGLPADLAAAVAGISSATAARWARLRARGERMVKKRGPAKEAVVESAEVADHVRHLKGLVGAESLRKTFPALSRRAAAAIKASTLAKMERDRKAEANTIKVSLPGVMRGFDAMHVVAGHRRNYLLVCADACVPYRTTLEPAPAYRSHAVAALLEQDFLRHGAPLVLRLDRASVHRTEEVNEVLRAFGVLPLHGPPYLARYYGQLERQNREHRAWLRDERHRSPDSLPRICDEMRAAFNELWRRGTLEFRTSAELWAERPTIDDDRESLRLEVNERRERLLRNEVRLDLAERLAIEQTLIERGHLSIEKRGRR